MAPLCLLCCVSFQVDLTKYTERHDFGFDAVFDEHVTNEEVSAKNLWCCWEKFQPPVIRKSAHHTILQLFFNMEDGDPSFFEHEVTIVCYLGQVYRETVGPIVPAIFEKTKATCFAYGQTGKELPCIQALAKFTRSLDCCGRNHFLTLKWLRRNVDFIFFLE